MPRNGNATLTTLAFTLALALGPAVAGCVTPPLAGSAADAAETASAGNGSRAYEREDEEHAWLRASNSCDPVPVGCGMNVYSASAEFQVPPGVRVLNGTLKAEWEAGVPLADTLTVRVARENGEPGERVEGTGSSPLVIDLSPTGLAPGAYSVRAYAETGALVDQEVRYVWTLTLQSEDGVETA